MGEIVFKISAQASNGGGFYKRKHHNHSFPLVFFITRRAIFPLVQLNTLMGFGSAEVSRELSLQSGEFALCKERDEWVGKDEELRR